MDLVIEPVWNWPLLIVTAVAMIGVVLWTYPDRVAHLAPRWRWTLLSLRLAAAVILILAMLRPSIQIEEADDQLMVLQVLLDASRSMSTPDGPGGLSRREVALKMLRESEDDIAELREQGVDVQFYDVGEDLKSVTEPQNEATGAMTPIGKWIEKLSEDLSGERPIASILVSDGAQRAGGEHDVDPLAAARRYAEQQGVPIHTVPVGASEVSTVGVDFAIEDLQLDQSVTFEKKTVPVHLQVQLRGAVGKRVRVQLLIEDRTGKRQGESGEMKTIPLSTEATPFRELDEIRQNSVTIPLDLSFVAEQPGEYKIAAEVVADPGEVKLNNNRRETLITVRRGGLKVAYFDIPRTEQRFIRRLNETAKIQIDTQAILSGDLIDKNEIDDSWFQDDAYDVYIIGDVPASVFERSGKDLLRQLALKVEQGAGLMMTGGLNNFGAGGYAETPLVEFLPVKMSSSDRVPYGQTRPEAHINTPVRMLPTESGNDQYVMRLSATQNRQSWEQLPEMSGATKLEPKSGVVAVLAESVAGDPLLLASDTGKGRVLALAVDETWKWHLHGFQAEHQRFWQQVILWLAHKEFESDQAVWVRVEPRNFSPHSKVPIEFGAQDADGSPLPDANFQVEVLTPAGETKKVPAQKLADHGLAEFVDTTEPGDYWVNVQGIHNGQSLGLPSTARFVVDARDIEMDNPAADPGLLAEIADMTSGSVIAVEEFAKFLERLRESGIRQDLTRYRRINLWDGWPPLLAFIALMSLEWFFRKWKGLV